MKHKRLPDKVLPEDLMRHPGHLMRRAVQVMNLLWDDEVSHTITSPQFAALNALYSEPNLDILLSDRGDLWEPWMRQVDHALEDARLLEIIQDAWKRLCKKSKTRGRPALYSHSVLHCFQPMPLRPLARIKCRRTFFSTHRLTIEKHRLESPIRK